MHTLEKLAAELQKNFDISVEMICADLSLPEEVNRLVERLQSKHHPVEILVNNAGFGVGKALEDAPLEAHMAQVEVLAKVPLQLMYVACEQMLSRGRGRIINVASVAAFMPNGTYSAAKQFLVTVSESAHLQYSARGVDITAVCPGLTRSSFHDAMGVEQPKLPAAFWLTPEQVVKAAIEANLRGKALCIPSVTYKLMVTGQKLLPPRLTTSILARTRSY